MVTIMPLQLSLLSSFYSRGIMHPTESIRTEVAQCLEACEFVEVYVMMESEAIGWANTFGRAKIPVTATEFFSTLTDDEIRQIAERLTQNLGKLDPSPRIVALASFLPEIAAQPGTPPANVGVGAVRNVMKLARALQHHKHPTHVVEMVAGSRIRGIELAAAQFQAQVTVQNPGQDDLVENLQAVLDWQPANDENALNIKSVYLAVEAEPGPIFLLNDAGAIRSFAERVSRNDTLRNRVGFNLDISHWRMEDVPVNLLAHPKVRPLVLHAHISGHHRRAHLGDTNPQWINGADEFEPWITALQSLPVVSNGEFGFRGIVSLEYEAAKQASDVQEAIEFFRPLL